MSIDLQQIQTSCENILHSVRRSGLNFSAQETPFSIYFTVRKSKLKSKYPHNQILNSSFQVDAKNTLEDEIKATRKCYDDLLVKYKHLENAHNKVRGCYKDAVDDCEVKNKSIEQLETKVKDLSDGNSELKSALKKVLKEKEYEVTHLKDTSKKVNDDYRNAIEELKVSNKEKANRVKEFRELQKEANSYKNLNLKLERKICTLKGNKKLVTSVSIQTEHECEALEKQFSSEVMEADSNNNLEECDSTPVNDVGKHFKICRQIGSSDVLKCSHAPQCISRNPQPPPPFLPLNWVDHFEYYEPSAPPNIKLLPEEVESVGIFYSLSSKHQCEECAPGSLFSNHHETVYYPDPGPCGGISGSQIKTCPNHPNATNIKLLTIAEPSVPYWKVKKLKQKKFKCNICDERFVKMSNLIFHVNRKHSMLKKKV